jgi:hypothetical protein
MVIQTEWGAAGRGEGVAVVSSPHCIALMQTWRGGGGGGARKYYVGGAKALKKRVS